MGGRLPVKPLADAIIESLLPVSLFAPSGPPKAQPKEKFVASYEVKHFSPSLEFY